MTLLSWACPLKYTNARKNAARDVPKHRKKKRKRRNGAENQTLRRGEHRGRPGESLETPVIFSPVLLVGGLSCQERSQGREEGGDEGLRAEVEGGGNGRRS